MTEIVTLGETMVSFVAEQRGPLAAATRFLRVVGGAEANISVGLARLGHAVAYIGRLGDDPWATVIRRTLRGEGVETRWLVTDPAAPTGVMMRELRDIGPMEVIYHRAGSAASRIGPEDIRTAAGEGAFDGIRWLHVTGITPALSASAADAVRTAVAEARTRGATVSLDLNIRRRLWSEAEAHRTLAALAAGCDVVIGGRDEAALVGGCAATLESGGACEAEAVADALLALGPRTAVIKLGPEGALARRAAPDGSRTTYRAPALPARVVDPVGAGDAFSAAWIAWTLEGAEPVAALRAGNAAGAAVVTTIGDLEGIPTRRELAALLAEGGPDTIR